MPRVLLMTDALGNGGAERQFTLLATMLPAEWERQVVSLSGGVFVEPLRSAGVVCHTLDRSGRIDPGPLLKVGSIIREYQPHVIHAWGWMTSLSAVPAAVIQRISLVDGTIRSGCLPAKNPRISRAAFPFARVIVANSAAGLEAYGVTGAKGRVVPNGFDQRRLSSIGGVMRQPLAGRPLVVVMAARMAPEKDFALFIEAAKILDRSYPGRWHFVVVGSGIDRPRLEAAGRELLSSGVMSMPDGGTEIVPILAGADIGVLLSHPLHHAEGCSNSLLEYMACGLPVVCTDSGGNREVVTDGDTGFVVPASDVDAVVEALERFMDNTGLVESMGSSARIRVATHYSCEAMVRSWISVYESVLPSHYRKDTRQ